MPHWKPNRKPSTYQRVAGEGPVPCRVMFIGERPGYEEDQSGRPFVGLAGSELTRYLAAGGLERENIYITNLVKTYRDGEKPTPEEIAEGWPELLAEINAVQPEIIALGGKYAIEAMTGPHNVEDVHGVPVWVAPVIVMPMFHPAAGFYDADSQPLILDDFKRLGQLVRGELLPAEDAYPPDALTYAEIRGSVPRIHRAEIAVDTEGWAKSPWSAQYSWAAGSGFLIRAGEGMAGWRQQMKEYQARGGITYVHNSLHDLEVLRELGVELVEGQYYDTMVWAYLLQTEPQGLKPLAWRHAGMRMHNYGEITKEANDGIALAWLEYVTQAEAAEGNRWWNESEPFTIVKGGAAKICKPHSLSRRAERILADREKKVDTDVRARWGKIEHFLRSPLEEKYGAMPTATLSDIDPKVAVDYACRDSDATIRIAPRLRTLIEENGLWECSEIDHSVIPMFDRMQHVGIATDPEWWPKLEERCWAVMNRCVHNIFTMTGAQINPNSGDQCAALLFDQLGLPGREDKKVMSSKVNVDTGEREERYSTIDKVLQGIIHLHPVVREIDTYREAAKVKDSYVRVIQAKAQQDPNNRLHPNWRLTRVVSGRPSCFDPNLLSIPVRTELGKEVRGGFVAAPGCVLYDVDLDQIEMRGMADESGDPTLCGHFNAGRDIHTQTAMSIFGIPEHEVDKMLHRYPAKRVGFGIITGITGYGLLDQMRLAGSKVEWTEEDCDKLIEEWFKVYPGVRAYIHMCRTQAKSRGWVRDRWGRLRLLPGAQSPITKIREEACRQSHSHRISGGAQGIMKRAQANVWHMIKEWWQLGWHVEPLLQIYDELVLEVQDDPTVRAVVDCCVVDAMCNTTKLKVPVGAKGNFAYRWRDAKD